MVTVKTLIKKLEEMPPNLQVGVAVHDDSAHQVSGWVKWVHVDTDDEFRDNPGKKCVVLRC